MSTRIAIIHGPNLNLIGIREPEIYGSQSFDDVLVELRSEFPDVTLEFYQSNHEGQLINWLHMLGFSADGIILNAGAYTHTSIALRDAIAAITTPVVEVHISDISSREPFRQTNYLRDVCADSITGRGMQGYHDAIRYFVD